MNILAFDTSSEVLSVTCATERSTATWSVDPGLSHTERLLEAVDLCVSRAGIDASGLDLVACALGPGSFTGLRIGMATAKGLALARSIPWIGIPTLDCLAWGLDAFAGAVVPVLDGRKGRVYAAVYLRGRRTGDWLDIPPAELAPALDCHPRVLFTGPDAGLMGDYARERSGFFVFERCREGASRAMAELAREAFGRGERTADDAGPLYLRAPEAEASVLR